MQLSSAVARMVHTLLRNMRVSEISKRHLLVLPLPSPDVLPREITKLELLLLLLLRLVPWNALAARTTILST